MTAAAPRVVVTMPAYRAELTLAKTVADIPSGVADRLILVDDASPDNTAQLARDLGIEVHVHPRNRGYGGNQKTCFTLALQDGAEIVVLLHPDYQYEPKAVPLLIAPILAGHADMTFGSRFAGLGDPRAGGMPLYRFVGNRATTILENFMLGSRFTEMHSGMRAYTRACLLALPFLRYSDDFVFDSQILIDAVTAGQRVVEVPIPTRYTQESSSISVERSLRYVGGSLAYCMRSAAARGRRGRRWPVTEEGARAWQASGQRPSAGHPLVRSQDPVRRALEALEGYFVPGRRLLVAGDEAGQAARWAGEREWEAAPLEEGASGDAVAVLGPADARSALAAGRSALAAEGILALSVPARKHASRDVRGLLEETGLRMVEWDGPGRRRERSGSRVLVLARPGGES